MSRFHKFCSHSFKIKMEKREKRKHLRELHEKAKIIYMLKYKDMKLNSKSSYITELRKIKKKLLNN